MKRQTFTAASLALVMLTAASCGGASEERAEQQDPTATSEANTLEFERVPSDDDSAPEALASQDTEVVAGGATGLVVDARSGGRGVNPDNGLHEVRSASEVNPQWVSQPEAFDFFAPELFSGAPVSGADLFQSGPVLMTFVSPSCAVSIEDGPDFADSAEWNQSITYVFVHTDGDQESFEQFVEHADLFHQNIIHINDEDLTLWNRFGIETQPSTVLLNRDGQASVTSGGLDYEGLATATSLLTPAA